jgi:hypothetical protein
MAFGQVQGQVPLLYGIDAVIGSLMDLMHSFDAIPFQADERPPYVVSLMTCNNPHAPVQMSMARVPHLKVRWQGGEETTPSSPFKISLGDIQRCLQDACDCTPTEHTVLMSKEQY